MKDVQNTGEASSHEREHPALLNMKFILSFLFCGSILPSWVRIRIQPTEIYADPDRQQWPVSV